MHGGRVATTARVWRNDRQWPAYAGFATTQNNKMERSMSTKVGIVNSMLGIRLVFFVWWIALAVGWTSAAAAAPAEDLINAAFRGDVATVQALLSQGVDANAKTNDGSTALMAAS